MSWLYLIVFSALVGLMLYLLTAGFMSKESKRHKLIVLMVCFLVPTLSLLTYYKRGAYDEVSLVELMSALTQQNGENSMEAINTYQRHLEVVASNHSKRAEYWYLLGDLHMDLGDFPSAIEAFQSASSASPNDISIVSRLAEAEFVLADYRLTESVKAHVETVLAAKPLDSTVLGILGVSAYRAGQFDAAIRFWERSLTNLPPFSPTAQSIQASINQARLEIGEQASDAAASSTSAHAISDTQEGLYIDVDVRLHSDVSANPSTFVFVFARQVNGPPMPVVVERTTVADLPVRLRMDDSKVMIQGQSLANFQQLELVARVSFSGSPVAVNGDYEVVYGPINPAEVESVIQLEIKDQVVK